MSIFSRLRSYEKVFLIFAPLFTFLVLWTGFPLSYMLFRLILDKIVQYLLLLYALAVVVVAIKAVHQKLSGAKFPGKKQFWASAAFPYLTFAYFLRSLSRTIVILFTLYFFLHFKHLILWWHPANYDLFFWNADRLIHGGIQPNIWLLDKISPHPEVGVGLDWLYSTFFRYPVLAEVPETYSREFLEAKIWTAKGYQERLWIDRRLFLKREQVPGIFYGIAAFPSLHVGISVLFALYFFQASALAGIFASLYALAMAIGSVFLQWHYAVDGYGGALLALTLYLLTVRGKPSK